MSTTSENTGSPAPPTATRIAEMRLVDNSSNPTVISVGKITSSWTGHILDKDDGKYEEWAYTMELELSMVQLWEYIFDPPPSPHPTYEPRAHRAWASNKRLAASFLKRAISPSEQKLCIEREDPVDLWNYLKDRHGGVVLVRQVRLLQEALTIKCSSTKPLTKTVDTIFDKIDRAFDAGDVTKDLLKSIAALSALSDKSYNHISSIISRDLGQAGDTKIYGPAQIRQFLQGKQVLMDLDKSGDTPADTTRTAFAAKPSRGSRLICSTCKARNRPAHVHMGHTAPWCILEGGAMEGKTLEESKKARLAYYDKKDKDRKKTLKITFTPAGGGNAFTLEGDSDTIAAYLASQTVKCSCNF